MSAINSNAYNFLSFVSSGVDPRTGTYSCSLSLSDFLANTLSGPSLPVALGFSALNNENVGFGRGWTMTFSQYNAETRKLSLASGASYLANTAPGMFVIVDKKVRDLKTSRVGDDLIIEHKSGIVEVLTNPSLNSREWLVSKIYSPEGRVVHLTYSAVAGRRLLSDIRDESQTLLTVDVRAGSTQVSSITLWPDSPTDKLVFRLQQQNNELTKVTLALDNGTAASWRLRYQTVNGLRLINRLELPTDGIETIAYRPSALRLPNGAPVSALPAVAAHSFFPRANQPPIIREYRYSTNNYLGYGSNARWRNDGDNLYQATGNYQYETYEDLVVGSGANKRVMRRTKRVYNRFHLQVEETVNQRGKTVRHRTHYHEKPSLKFDDQPGNFQMPAKTEVSWFDAANPGVTRDEITLTEYDDFGNILKKVSPSGITEVFEYYPLDACDGCPGDTFGAIRWLKQKTLIPAPDLAPAPTLTTHYRYAELPSASPERGQFLALVQEAVMQEGGTTPCLVLTRQYEVEPQSPFFGRIKQTTETVQGFTTVFDHSYELVDGAVQTHTTMTAHDGCVSNKDICHNRLTGAEVKTVEQLGVTLETTHDRLGRKTLEMLAPKTSGQAQRSHRYLLADKLGDAVQTQTVAANGAMTMTKLDGMGRKALVEVQDMDAAAQPMRSVYAAKYDALGQLAEETNADWLDGKLHGLTTRYTYDDWGNREASIGPDRVKTLEQNDPITLTQTHGMESAGKTVIRLNAFGKQDSVERFDRHGKSISITEYLYDGLGRCVQQTDPYGRNTRFAYDFADRLMLTQLPDGTQIKKTFAPHSTEDLATQIWVNDYLAGQRTYDGLMRVTSLTVGGRTETFTYEGAQPSPASHTTASGKVISYKYDPALNNQVIERNVAGNSNLAASFRYDSLHAKLLQASSASNQHQRHYSPSGQLKGDQLGEGQGMFDTAQRSSLNGLPLQYTNSSGVVQFTRYDALCRIAQVQQGSVKADYSYDGLGRVSKIETVDTQSKRTLTTQLEYDDFGREVKRVLRVDLNPAEELSQRFDGSDKLIQRTLQRGATIVRDEKFAYDVRGRLVDYACSGTHLPVDAAGKAVLSQAYVFDELDNVREMKTVFAGGQDTATYEYEFTDKTQLSRVRHSHPDYAAHQATFTYDRDGNQLNDQRGRRMTYDELGRLASVAQEPA